MSDEERVRCIFGACKNRNYRVLSHLSNISDRYTNTFISALSLAYEHCETYTDIAAIDKIVDELKTNKDITYIKLCGLAENIKFNTYPYFSILYNEKLTSLKTSDIYTLLISAYTGGNELIINLMLKNDHIKNNVIDQYIIEKCIQNAVKNGHEEIAYNIIAKYPDWLNIGTRLLLERSNMLQYIYSKGNKNIQKLIYDNLGDNNFLYTVSEDTMMFIVENIMNEKDILRKENAHHLIFIQYLINNKFYKILKKILNNYIIIEGGIIRPLKTFKYIYPCYRLKLSEQKLDGDYQTYETIGRVNEISIETTAELLDVGIKIDTIYARKLSLFRYWQLYELYKIEMLPKDLIDKIIKYVPFMPNLND
jgi:hypothetical protein